MSHTQQPAVLGVDPGLTRCGLGLVRGPAHQPRMVTAEVVNTDPGTPIEQRLVSLADAVDNLLAVHRPAAVAVEQVLFSANARTAMSVGQAAGVVLLAAGRAGITVVTYSPTDVKLTVAGHGAADKDAVARMVAAQLHLESVPRPADAADGLAVALCHLTRAGRAIRAGPGRAAAEPGWAAASLPRGGWEAIVDRPHVRVVADTGRCSDDPVGGDQQ